MGNFNRDDRRGGGRGFGGRDFGRRDFRGGGFDRRGGDRPTYKAVCSNCGRECEVPFRPTSGKPVFCSECFEKRSREAGHDNFPDRGPRRSNFEGGSEQPQYKEQFNILNAKLDKILSILGPSSSPKVVQEEKSEEKKVEEKPKKVVEKAEKKKKTTKKETSVEPDSLV